MIQAILLGVIQGLTEFLPVSSSGHLVLAQQALGDSFPFADTAVIFDLVLHAGTLVPVLWFYRLDLLRMVAACWPFSRKDAADLKVQQDRRMVVCVVIGSIPTALIGIMFKDTFEGIFHNITAVCAALLVTGALLLSTRFTQRQDGSRRVTALSALLIGLVQGAAITPGISRSGSTIATALLLGVSREEAARFSFLLSVPAIVGAILFMLKDGAPLTEVSIPALAAGFMSSLIVGYAALVMLIALVRRGGLHRFAYYLGPLAATAWLLLH